YKHLFQEPFWEVIDKDLNGTSHCQYDYTGNRVTPNALSWSCFKLKRVNTATEHEWKQPSIHITWDHQTGRQVVYIFDFPLSGDRTECNFLKDIPSIEARKHNPFAWHAAFSRSILQEYETTYWDVRNPIRKHERVSLPRQRLVPSFFTDLHDFARHAFHYSEIIGVAENTLSRLIEEQGRWRREDEIAIREGGAIPYWLDSHQELLLQQKNAFALKAKSKSLNERLLNEINLGFNLVLQADGERMKTIAFVSMVYLPGTFVSGVFGTNFFDFDAPSEGGWAHSHFWLYWAVALPLTFATMGVWLAWHRRAWIHQQWDSLSLLHGKDNADSGGLQRNGTELSILGLARAVTGLNRKNVKGKESV
ncbi:hypothetical protein ASPSYDRAFT_143050, partial [Aspergillus sydowii CBS 593.65]